MAFRETLEYLYLDINKYKNFSQKKIKFLQYYKKILRIFNNNLGFYTGCLMWASYLKTQDEQEILNNHCLGKEYCEEDCTADVDYMLKFVELFPKDMKYFISETFEFPPKTTEILTSYKEFLIINKGFINTKNSSELLLPNSIKLDNAETFKEKIDDALLIGSLEKLVEYKDLILK